MMLIHHAKLVGENGITEGALLLREGKIEEVFDRPSPDVKAEQSVDAKGCYAAPGFIELHSHGAGGSDFMDGTAEDFVTACRTHLAHGITTILPTLSGNSQEFQQAIDALREARRRMPDGPYIPGLHLEGPYFSMAQRGGQDPRFIKNPDPQEYRALIDYAKGDIARWSVAPELPGALEMGDYLREKGILASIGHSDAEYIQVEEAVRHGYTHVTHLYSGMSTIVRRGGFRFLGVTESAYALEELTVEMIADGCHLPPELLRMIYRLKGPDKVCMITDSLRCCGQDVTESLSGSRSNGQRIIVEDGVAKIPDRSAFAGSIATADRLLYTAYHLARIPLVDCVKMMTLTPARIMGIADRKGSLLPGKDADVVLFDEEIRLSCVIAGGKLQHGETPGNIS